jgi:8-oxo-dGTP diphosphatase
MGKDDQGLQKGKRRFQVIPRVLVFLRNKDAVLLLKGSPDKRIWANLYNGVGGHVEVGEDIYSAALREVHEETGLVVSDLELKAIANIDVGDRDTGIMMFVFVGWTKQRRVVSSIEGGLHWKSTEALPEKELVEDLAWLLPRLLKMQGEQAPMYLHYHYDANDKLIIRRPEVVNTS